MDCGPEGTCVMDDSPNFHCKCNLGATNVLNRPSYPCIKNCKIDPHLYRDGKIEECSIVLLLIRLDFVAHVCRCHWRGRLPDSATKPSAVAPAPAKPSAASPALAELSAAVPAPTEPPAAAAAPVAVLVYGTTW